MAKADKILHTKKALIDALHSSLGVVTKACEKVGISRQTFYEYYNNDKDFKNQVDEIENVSLDFVESQLFQQIKDGNTTATIFYLKTKGKSRGYVERQEIDHSTKGFKIEFSKDVNNLAGLSPSKTKGDTTKQKKI